MQDIADSYFEDSYPVQKLPEDRKEKLKPSLSKTKDLDTDAHLYPIDETEDFHDPFSDLNLFLSKKIKTELQESGSAKQWSQKIEKDLLKKILPEFKVQFPKYRLGVSAIKKVWEKVSYYYGKVQTQEEAIKSDGKLNIDYMIKENLRSYAASSLKSDMPHYTTAHQLAIRLSECIATLDGTRPRLDHLTKVIWAAQKHLLKDLPSSGAKNAYEEYDNVDKLIVRILLEKTAKDVSLPKADLSEEIQQELMGLYTLTKNYPKEVLYQNIAKKLSARFYPRTGIFHLLSKEEKKSIFAFIEKQKRLVSLDTSLSKDSILLEVMQRVLSLYPIAECLPKTLDKEMIKKAVHLLYHKNGSVLETSPLHKGLLAFVQAELHFLKRKNICKSLKELEAKIEETISDAMQLPLWQDSYAEELEIFVWAHFSIETSLTGPLKKLLEKETANVLLDQPHLSFRTALHQVLDFLRKIKTLLVRKEQEDQEFLFDDLNHKIDLWSVQNDMLCRWIHFDPNTPLLVEIKKSFHKNKGHEEIVSEALASYKKKSPSCFQEEELLKIRASILYKYYWYHHLTDTEESSLDRFIKWHFVNIKEWHPELSLDDKITVLEKRLVNLLPLTPFSRKKIERLLSSF